MGFSKCKNKYGDLVDDVDDLFMYGPQVSSVVASSIRLVTIPKLSTPYVLYSIENNTKYSIAKRGRTNDYWGYNPHYGWNKFAHDLLTHFPGYRVTEVQQNENEEIVLNDTGSMKYLLIMNLLKDAINLFQLTIKRVLTIKNMDVFGLLHTF